MRPITPDAEPLPVDPAGRQQLHPLSAIVIVFLSNFCIMVLELVAGRMMAPIVGVSLYTWTSIIGVILAGISLGNYLGGKIADRLASRVTLALLFVLAAFGSASILGIIELVNPLLQLDVPVIARVVLIFTAVFLLPSTILGTISPVVVKLTLADLSRTGDVVGKIYAAGAVGSIIGTFATGFFLISAFGTRLIIWGVVGSLLVIGAVIGLNERRWRYAASLLVGLFLALSALAWQQGWLNSRCLRETNYFCIKVRPDSKEPNVRILTLDRLVHSYVDLDDPLHLRYGYERTYADVLKAVFPGQPPLAVMFIGGGGYTFPHYMELTYPGSRIEVVEIDPGVTETAYSDLGLPTSSTIVSYNEDARHFIDRLPAGQQYDLILGDAFNDFSVPYHLTTLEFDRTIAAHLSEQGIYMVNIIDGRQGKFLRAYLHTLQQVFSHVYLAARQADLGTSARQTLVIVASNYALPINPGKEDGSVLDQQFIAPAGLAAYLQAEQPVILNDDYVPVDNLLAPVFADSGF